LVWSSAPVKAKMWVPALVHPSAYSSEGAFLQAAAVWEPQLAQKRAFLWEAWMAQLTVFLSVPAKAKMWVPALVHPSAYSSEDAFLQAVMAWEQ
jgi:hypothetical protein